jgi:predicted nucleic acid-binding Zn ribbon protein
MSLLEQMNDWCGEVLNKAIRYDDLITFTMFSILLIVMVVCMVMGILGGLGYLQ